MKVVCPIHRFSYSGNVCPFCEQERINYLTRKYGGEECEVVTKKKEREINENDLQKLMEKFNKK